MQHELVLPPRPHVKDSFADDYVYIVPPCAFHREKRRKNRLILILLIKAIDLDVWSRQFHGERQLY
jgi:hypothetical protein